MNEETRRKFLIRSIGSLGATIPIIYYGCDTGGTGGGPLGPSEGGVFTTSSTSVSVSPPSVTLTKGSTQTFTATGGTGTFTWSSSNTALGTIGVSTGTFTAGTTTGTVNVLATDTLGTVGSGAVTIVSATIAVTPAIITIPNLPIPTVAASVTVTFTATGGTAPYSYNLSGLSAAAVTQAAFTINLTTGVFTTTALPAADETVTITATDAFGDTGTATLTLSA